ncbi:MAG: deoxyribose-phosphate aldolase [Calditrichaeota bacterium]|nr:deoxyribose-phosphate aldolase [Calditrichota bacterium]
MTREQAASFIDHTILKPEATEDQVRKLCAEAREFQFKSVCVNSRFVSLCAEQLKGSPVLVCAVAGFPLGAMSTEAKLAEARIALRDGARELDMVLWVGGLLSGEENKVREDIAALAKLCRAEGAALKVIFEISLLNSEQIVHACEISVQAGAHWVKTSTGFGSGGATLEAVERMHRTVHDKGLKVKASGGIRTLADFEKMVSAGAERIGTSSGVAILRELS